MKRSTRILLAAAAVIALIIYTLYDAFFAAPKRISLRSETLSSEKIPASMDGIRILFFSDLEYGTFMDSERLAALTERINDASADIIIFGGDMFDTGITPDDAMTAELASSFSEMKAPLGKFAVYGDNDHENDAVYAAFSSICSAGSFEILENSSVALRNRSNGSITLVGIDSSIGGTQDITAAYSSVSHTNYVIAVSHTPDTADLVPADLTDYFLAGHTHGGQAFWLFGSYYSPQGSENYLRGKQTVAGSFTLDITNGTGTTGRDVRLFADAEIVVYTLRSEEKQEETESPEPSSSASPSPSADSTASPAS